jgi:hypothetical protein
LANQKRTSAKATSPRDSHSGMDANAHNLRILGVMPSS